jgi:hypothetical protein
MQLNPVDFTQSPIISGLVLFTPLLITIYLASIYLYRLFFHPLAKYPGPKLAAISNWYEFYYDVIQHGSFTVHIQELHKKYGMLMVLFILSNIFTLHKLYLTLVKNNITNRTYYPYHS